MSNESTNHVIGLSVDIEIEGINSAQPIRAKVDTGADVCSLHAQNIEVIGMVEMAKTVRFQHNDRIYTLPIEGFQTVVSASGTTQRPLVFLDVRINGQFIEHVQFNLADRSDMDAAVLIGKNLLDVCGFVIDPTREEEEQTSNEDEERNRAADDVVTFPPVQIVTFNQPGTENDNEQVQATYDDQQSDHNDQSEGNQDNDATDQSTDAGRVVELCLSTIETLVDLIASQPDSENTMQRLHDILSKATNKGA